MCFIFEKKKESYKTSTFLRLFKIGGTMETSLVKKLGLQFLFAEYKEKALEEIIGKLLASSYIRKITSYDDCQGKVPDPKLKKIFRSERLALLAEHSAIILSIADVLSVAQECAYEFELFDEKSGKEVQQEICQKRVYKDRLKLMRYQWITPWPIAKLYTTEYLFGESYEYKGIPISSLILTDKDNNCLSHIKEVDNADYARGQKCSDGDVVNYLTGGLESEGLFELYPNGFFR